jgi:hypothetical protein
MYVILLVAFPILFLFNPYLAAAALVAGIVGMYVQRTTPAKPPASRPSGSTYKAGYED